MIKLDLKLVTYVLSAAVFVSLFSSPSQSFDAYNIFEFDTAKLAVTFDNKYTIQRTRMKRLLFIYPDSTWKMPNFDCGWKWRLKEVIDVDSGKWSVYSDTLLLKSQVCYKRNDTCIYGWEKYHYVSGEVRGERVTKAEIDKDSIPIKMMRKFIKEMNEE